MLKIHYEFGKINYFNFFKIDYGIGMRRDGTTQICRVLILFINLDCIWDKIFISEDKIRLYHAPLPKA